MCALKMCLIHNTRCSPLKFGNKTKQKTIIRSSSETNLVSTQHLTTHLFLVCSIQLSLSNPNWAEQELVQIPLGHSYYSIVTRTHLQGVASILCTSCNKNKLKMWSINKKEIQTCNCICMMYCICRQQTSFKKGIARVTGSLLTVFFKTDSFFPPCRNTSCKLIKTLNM